MFKISDEMLIFAPNQPNMKVKQLSLTEENWYNLLPSIKIEANLFLLFVSPNFKAKVEVLKSLNDLFPSAIIVGCSTAGEIHDVTVQDDTITLTAIQMEKVTIKKVSVGIKDMDLSFQAGQEVAQKLQNKNLKHIMLFSDGLNVNGADLVAGLKLTLPKVSITGGLAGDGSNFKETFIINNNEITDKTIVAIGFYGDHFKVGFSSQGGWDTFGIERLVTKSHKNVLFELDGKPALDIYKSYLGEQAKNLPSSGLMFPLSMRTDEKNFPVVRTILAINEEQQSLTFAGNIPEGSYVKLMKANIDHLINGAEQSAKIANKDQEELTQIAVLISCVGRRLVLKQLVEEEVEAVRGVVGANTLITGFYSYGEIAPFDGFSPCELHNQSMTITTFSEC